MKLTWYGHSCFLLESAEGTVVFDPYAPDTVPGLALPELYADLVVCSHMHSDHFYPQGVTLSGRRPSFGIQQMDTFHDGEKGALRGDNTVTVIEADGLRTAHFGDLGHLLAPEQIAELGRIDVMLVPVGGFYTIDAGQAKAVVDQLKPRVVVPMHYRGKDFGYEVIGPVEDFLALQSGVVRYEGNVLELTQDTPAQTAVLTYLG